MKAMVCLVLLSLLVNSGEAFGFVVHYGECAGGPIFGFVTLDDTDPTDPEAPPDYFFFDKSTTMTFKVSDGSEEFDPVALVDTLLAYLDSSAAAWNDVGTQLTLDITTDWSHTVVNGNSTNSIIWVDSLLGDPAGRTIVTALGEGINDVCDDLDEDEDFAEIVDADIFFNDEFTWRKNKQECPANFNQSDGDEMDIQSIATHELGHATGIAHSNVTDNTCPTMQSGGDNCSSTCASGTESLEMRSLATDDIDAYEFLYDQTNSVKDEQGNGGTSKLVVESLSQVQALPATASLSSVYPNPFNSEIAIKFELGVSNHIVSLEVYNLAGQKIRALVESKTLHAGFYTRVWDGKDASGQDVATGTYLVTFKVGNLVEEALKVSLIR